MPELLDAETAKAVQEVAKTAQKVIDAGQKFGGFFAKYFGGNIEQWAGLYEDKLRYRRWENQLALMQKAEEKLKALGSDAKLKPLAFKIGVPLLEAASLEDNDYLRDLWANLLINSVKQENVDTHPSFVQVLQNLLPQEAKLLECASKNCEDGVVINILDNYDDNYFDNSELKSKLELKEIEFVVQASLEFSEENKVFEWFDNLIRLKLLEKQVFYDHWHEKDKFNPDPEGRNEIIVNKKCHQTISITAFGKAFISAVTNP